MFLSFEKSIFLIVIFCSEIEVKNFFLKIGKKNWLKMQSMTQRDKLITKNYVLAH